MKRFAFTAFAFTVLLAGCVPARPVAVSPAPAPQPQRVEPARPAPRPEPPRAEQRRAPEREGVYITTVAASPQSVRPGDSVDLVVEYDVEMRRGRTTDVNATFEVRFDDSLASMPTLTRSIGMGSYQSRVTLIVPPDAPRGWYDVEVYVASDAGDDVGGTEFMVR